MKDGEQLPINNMVGEIKIELLNINMFKLSDVFG